MRRPGFLEGVAVALAASILGSGSFVLLAPVLGRADALGVVVALAGLGYLLYLLRRGRARVGGVSMVALWLVITGFVAVLEPPLAVQVLAQLVPAWLSRALWFHRGVLPALMDLGLVAAGLAAAAWAAHSTASLALAIWCLMLVQAAFVFIPGRPARSGANRRTDPADPFQHAHRAAERALHRLHQSR